MKAVLILVASLTLCAWCVAQDTNLDQLIAQKSGAVQEQIASVYAALQQPGGIDTGSNVEAFRALQELKHVAADKRELVKQLAIFAITPGDEQKPLAANVILGWLHIPSHITIGVLAPYLDTKDDRLRAFVLEFFHGLDRADSGPFVCVNYRDYLEYVRRQMGRDEVVPAAFVKYIFERSPGQAISVFKVASVDNNDYIQLLNHAQQRAQEGRATTEQEKEDIRKYQAKKQREVQEGRETLLAEHIISNALWLKKHGFDDRLQAALPEAMEELKKLAKSEHWWARLYVVYIMRQHLVLRQDHVLRRLAEDSNPLVNETAKSIPSTD